MSVLSIVWSLRRLQNRRPAFLKDEMAARARSLRSLRNRRPAYQGAFAELKRRGVLEVYETVDLLILQKRLFVLQLTS